MAANIRCSTGSEAAGEVGVLVEAADVAVWGLPETDFPAAISLGTR